VVGCVDGRCGGTIPSKRAVFTIREVAKSLHDNVFSVGDTIDPAEGFRRFRGRDVDTGALLRKRGFPVD
jgi:peptidyl-dipeptidase Dcp